MWRQECDNSELEGVSSRVLYALQKAFGSDDLEISLLELDCNVEFCFMDLGVLELEGTLEILPENYKSEQFSAELSWIEERDQTTSCVLSQSLS